MNRKTLLAACLAAGSLMGIASVAHAVPAVVAPSGSHPSGPAVYGQPTVLLQPAPPPPLQEAVPAPRAGYFWAPGHYTWDGGRYVWRQGEWMALREGYGWQAARWEQRPDGSWALLPGTWVRVDSVAAYDDRGDRAWGYRDRDGDGVLNRDDRFPRDATRR